MPKSRLVEYTFFFSTLAIVGYLVVRVFLPFITALALAAVVVTICYPLYRVILKYVARQNRSVAAILATLVVFCAVVAPVSLVSTLLVNEFISFYRSLDTVSQLPIDSMLTGVEAAVQTYIPGFDINLSEQIKQSASWFASNLGTIFAGTVSAIFTFLIAMLGSFYLFRDGERFVQWLISISPLKDAEDKVIIDRVVRAVRSVATGTVLVAILQGAIAALGFSLFGIERAVLWGTVGALGALLPGLGTASIMVPAVGYLFFIGEFASAVGLTIWAIASIVVIDNLVSPYLMSRGNNLHPFVVLLAVLGGVSLFGPIGFILGPVIISLFMVLIEIYGAYLAEDVIVGKKRK